MSLKYFKAALTWIMAFVTVFSLLIFTILALEPDLSWEAPDLSFPERGGNEQSAQAQGPAAENVSAQDEDFQSAEDEAEKAERERREREEQLAAAHDAEAERLASLTDQEVWQELADYDLALIGDSRVVGFSLYQCVSDRRIFAKNGATVDDLQNQMYGAASLEPDFVFIAYGINDLKAGLGRSPEGYAEYLENKVRALEDLLPDAKIFVQSIIPARPFLYSETPAYGEVGQYNDALRERCAENGWYYVDNTAIAEECSQMYANDGIHLGAAFYPYWGKNILLALYDAQAGMAAE